MSKTISLSQEAVDTLKKARQDFIKTFGRVPAARDRTLLAAYRHGPDDTKRLFEEIATEANMPKHLIYAYRKTGGLLLTEENKDLASGKDLEEWREAVSEYFQAEELGIDLLKPAGALAEAMDIFVDFLEMAVVHFGSYVDRAPRRTRSNLPLFMQFLVLSKFHQCIKMLADAWKRSPGDEAFSLLRSSYECVLTVAMLEITPSYAEAMIAQALVGSDLYFYRKKKNGKIDYSQIEEASTGRIFPGRTSFTGCAKAMGPEHEALYNVLYPLLSENIHFGSLEMLKSYRADSKFLIWKEPKPEMYALHAIIVISYAAMMVGSTERITASVKRDAKFLLKKAEISFKSLIGGIDEDMDGFDEQSLLAAYLAHVIFQGGEVTEPQVA